MQHSTQNGTIPGAICECLVSFSQDDGTVSPVLLTGLPEASEDGLTYSFELAEGIAFHDGSTLTAEDVRYTFTRMFVPEQASVCSGYYVMIVGAQAMLDGEATELEGFTVEDDRHFTIRLEYPYAPFVSALTLAFAEIFPREACEAAGDDWGIGTLVGTGPYRLVSSTETGVSLEAFPDYHGGAPALDRLEIVYIDDNNTKMLNYKAGDVDACELDATLLSQYQGDAEVADQIVSYEPMGTCFVNVNLNMPEFSDPRVREALSLAINRQELVDTLLSGAGTPATQFLNPREIGYDDSREAYAYDPERARELLAEAGAEGLSFTAMTRASEQNIMVALQALLGRDRRRREGRDARQRRLDGHARPGRHARDHRHLAHHRSARGCRAPLVVVQDRERVQEELLRRQSRVRRHLRRGPLRAGRGQARRACPAGRPHPHAAGLGHDPALLSQAPDRPEAVGVRHRVPERHHRAERRLGGHGAEERVARRAKGTGTFARTFRAKVPVPFARSPLHADSF